MLFPKIKGIGRDIENPKSIPLYLERSPTDDEMRRIQDFLNDPYLQSEFELRGRSRHANQN